MKKYLILLLFIVNSCAISNTYRKVSYIEKFAKKVAKKNNNSFYISYSMLHRRSRGKYGKVWFYKNKEIIIYKIRNRKKTKQTFKVDSTDWINNVNVEKLSTLYSLPCLALDYAPEFGMYFFKNKKKLKSISLSIASESLYESFYCCFGEEINNNKVLNKIFLDMKLYKIY
jgi:hypothetical protein